MRRRILALLAFAATAPALTGCATMSTPSVAVGHNCDPVVRREGHTDVSADPVANTCPDPDPVANARPIA
jgi:hypothetical protein